MACYDNSELAGGRFQIVHFVQQLFYYLTGGQSDEKAIVRSSVGGYVIGSFNRASVCSSHRGPTWMVSGMSRQGRHWSREWLEGGSFIERAFEMEGGILISERLNRRRAGSAFQGLKGVMLDET